MVKVNIHEHALNASYTFQPLMGFWYVKISTIESIKFDISNLGRPRTRLDISTVERLRLKRRTFRVPNLMHKLW